MFLIPSPITSLLSPFIKYLPSPPLSNNPLLSPYYDNVLLTVVAILTFTLLVQATAFSRPPKLPRKKLLQRNKIHLKFTPEDPAAKVRAGQGRRSERQLERRNVGAKRQQYTADHYN